jgi:hypothetical protein
MAERRAVYAEKAVQDASKAALVFNCTQRAHQNTLENLPLAILMYARSRRAIATFETDAHAQDALDEPDDARRGGGAYQRVVVLPCALPRRCVRTSRTSSLYPDSGMVAIGYATGDPDKARMIAE